MPELIKLKPENGGGEYLPPIFYLEFSQEEFPGFLANPTGTLEKLGQPVKNLTVTVKDHVWDSQNQEWITDKPDTLFAEDGGLPPAQNWKWLCGYQDEMCVCERVLA